MTRNARVLIVDDEPTIRDILADYLISEGHDIFFARSGIEAVDHLDDYNPDVILLDVMMPEMDGFEVCHRIRSSRRWQHVPIILVTALDSRQDVIRGLDSGADEFLSKPVNGAVLRARVRSMLRIKLQYDSLQEMLRLREDLADMVAHDMKNPLATLILYTDLLARGTMLEDKPARLLEVIRSQAAKLDGFVNDLLLAAKLESDQLLLNLSQVDLRQLVLDSAVGYKALAESRQINLKVEIDESARLVSLDANLFGRVLDNLVSNALKFTPAEKSISILVEQSSGGTYPASEAQTVRVQVIDEGPGIPKEHHESIFEKFKIVDLKAKGVSQTGLGLSFCKLAVEAHGGTIFVEDNSPNGSIFTVVI